LVYGAYYARLKLYSVKLILRFLQDQSAVSTVECRLIFGGAPIAVTMIVKNLGDQLNTKFLRR
jgi:Flp pilus assembly pilin Flp